MFSHLPLRGIGEGFRGVLPMARPAQGDGLPCPDRGRACAARVPPWAADGLCAGRWAIGGVFLTFARIPARGRWENIMPDNIVSQIQRQLMAVCAWPAWLMHALQARIATHRWRRQALRALNRRSRE